jgi:hypothetical protein
VERVELLTVVERFQITGVGLVLAPDFSVPEGKWRNRVEQVLVVTPQEQEFEALAQFNLTHFNILDPAAPLDRRWRIMVALPAVLKEQVPVGSKVFASPEVRNAVLAEGKA